MSVKKPNFGEESDPDEVTKGKLKDWDQEIPDKPWVKRGKVSSRSATR